VTALQVQNWISDQLGRGIEDKPQEHALISSMVLGVHGDGLSETRAWFRDTGTLHLFAISVTKSPKKFEVLERYANTLKCAA
jgi:hypothetical protein